MPYVIRMAYDATICYRRDITKFEPYVIRMTKPLVVSHADDLWPMQYLIRITYDATLSHRDDKTTFE